MRTTSPLSSPYKREEKRKKEWEEAFQKMLLFASRGIFEKEIQRAHDIFFEKIGKSYEGQESILEAVVQSFHEWYVFEYETLAYEKTPAVIYISRGLDENHVLENSLPWHWSFFEVISFRKNIIYLKDLLLGAKRKVFFESEKTWRPLRGHIIQARLFHVEEELHFFTYMWLHPYSSHGLIQEICRRCQKQWLTHPLILKSALDAVIRTYEFNPQARSAPLQTKIYLDLKERYA